MGHGEVSEQAYTQVQEECYQEVLFIPSLNQYTRASMAFTRDRLDSLEKKEEATGYSITSLQLVLHYILFLLFLLLFSFRPIIIS